MDQGQGEADRDPGKARCRTLRRGADDDEQEEKGHHNFVYEAAPHTIFAWTEITIAVRGKSAHGPARFPRCDEPQYEGGDDRADDLGDDVRDDVLVGTAAGAP